MGRLRAEEKVGEMFAGPLTERVVSAISGGNPPGLLLPELDHLVSALSMVYTKHLVFAWATEAAYLFWT